MQRSLVSLGFGELGVYCRQGIIWALARPLFAWCLGCLRSSLTWQAWLCVWTFLCLVRMLALSWENLNACHQTISWYNGWNSQMVGLKLHWAKHPIPHSGQLLTGSHTFEKDLFMHIPNWDLLFNIEVTAMCSNCRVARGKSRPHKIWWKSADCCLMPCAKPS